MFYIGLYTEKHEKIFSEITRPRALYVDFYQVWSNYAPVAKTGSAPGVTRDMVSFQQIPTCKLSTKLWSACCLSVMPTLSAIYFIKVSKGANPFPTIL